MASRLRRRHRAWASLGVLLGLLIGGVPVADGCPMRTEAASGCHVEARPDPEPAEHRCCHPAEPAPAVPARAGLLPTPGPSGADSTCRTRTASCCCVAGATQAVAERSARAGASRVDSRIATDASPAARPDSGGRSLLIAAGLERPAPSKVPIYLRTARLRN